MYEKKRSIPKITEVHYPIIPIPENSILKMKLTHNFIRVVRWNCSIAQSIGKDFNKNKRPASANESQCRSETFT